MSKSRQEETLRALQKSDIDGAAADLTRTLSAATADLELSATQFECGAGMSRRLHLERRRWQTWRAGADIA